MSYQNHKDVVAVILPVYNTQKYLKECLDSLLRQTYSNFRVFAVDDGSTDGSSELLDQFSSQDDRIVVIHQANAGVASARNVALKSIRQNETIKYVCFVDSDDIVTSSFLETYVLTAKKYDADYVVCGIHSFDKNHHPLNEEYPLGSGNSCEMMTRKDLFEQAYGVGNWAKQRDTTVAFLLSNRFFSCDVLGNLEFDEQCKKGEDQEILDRILVRVSKGVAIDSVGYLYRKRASSLTSSVDIDENFLGLAHRCIERSLEWPPEARWGMQLRANLLWWKAVETVAMMGCFDQYRAKLTQMHKTLKRLDYIDVLPPKEKKRLALFSLGDFVVRAYFLCRKNKKLKQGNFAYFD